MHDLFKYKKELLLLLNEGSNECGMHTDIARPCTCERGNSVDYTKGC